MTDDKVKEAVERVRIGLAHRFAQSDGFYLAAIPGATTGDLRTLQAEMDKLSAEVERQRHENDRLHEVIAGIISTDAGNRADLEASEAKLTALVEAAQPVVDCWGVGQLNITAMTEFVLELRQALAHHSAPVGEAVEQDAFDLRGVREVVAEAALEDAGRWMTCSGCHETEDGYDVGHYPTSRAFNCKIGAGCRECGGLGMRWDTTDYAEMAEWIIRDMGAPPTTPTSAPVEDVGGLAWRPLEDAPKDGTFVLLLVDYSAEEACHALEDTAGATWTIGFNDEGHVEAELGGRWHFAGWCWSHDHFTEGKGRVVAWAPILKPEVAA